jgi:hypothetical protein
MKTEPSWLMEAGGGMIVYLLVGDFPVVEGVWQRVGRIFLIKSSSIYCEASFDF